MALAATRLSRVKTGTTIRGSFSIVASGNYATNGDALDFAPLIGFTNRQPKSVRIAGKSGFEYEYDYVNKKMLVFCNTAGGANAPLGEHTAAAYVAGVTGDTIQADCEWSTL
jgi:hypothetical protein